MDHAANHPGAAPVPLAPPQQPPAVPVEPGAPAVPVEPGAPAPGGHDQDKHDEQVLRRVVESALQRHLRDHLAEVERLVTAGGVRVRQATANERVPAWMRRTPGEPRWPVALTILVAIGLQLVVPARLALGPRWVLPAVELALLILLSVANPGRVDKEHSGIRMTSLALVVVVSVANAASVLRLVGDLVAGVRLGPSALLVSGGAIWLTNVIVFALWYWEFDRGGPAARAHGRQIVPDFLFPQMATPELHDGEWEPQFVDYLYLSFTNAAAFSPTDTMPLSRWAKLGMLAQAAVSLVTIALVIARAVNIFNG